MHFKQWLNENLSPDDVVYRLKQMLQQDLPEQLRKKLESLLDQLEASKVNPTPQDFQRIKQDFIHFRNAVRAVSNG